jgi:HEXXH motif-containing protein
MSFVLPSFLTGPDLLVASGRIHAIEIRELWKLWRNYCRQYAGNVLSDGLDKLVVGEVPDTPRLRHWCTVTKALLRAYRNGVGVSSGDVAHFELDRLAPERLTQLHSLRLLEAWIYDAANTTNCAGDLTMANPELPHRLELGRAGRLTPVDADRHAEWGIRWSKSEITIQSGQTRPMRHIVANESVGLTFPADWQYEPSPDLRHGVQSLHIPIYDAGLCNPHAGALAPIVRDLAVVAEWLPTVALALDCSAAADAALHADCLRYLGDVLPLYHGLGQAFGSASTEDALGYAFLPGIHSPLDIAECFVHEAMHQKLFRIESVLPLFESASPTGESYYSPWRRDPRPLRMVLHGCFVFTCVVHLWIQWAKNPPFGLSSRTEALKIAFRRSCEVLTGLDLLARYAVPTEQGARLISEIKEIVVALAAQADVESDYRYEVNAAMATHRQGHLEGSICSELVTF